MAVRGEALTINFTAWDTSANTMKTGDAANITMYIIKDGGVAAAVTPGTVSEPDSTNMPGIYEIALSGTEMTADFVTVGGTSSTANVEIMPTYVQTQDLEAILGTPAGASVSADIAVIEGQTDDIGVAGAGLTAINLPDQTMNITGNLSGSVGSVTGSVGSVVGHTAQTGDTFALANGASGFVAIVTDLDDIKGTGFVKDTHSLIDIETFVDILDDGTSGNVKIATDVAAVLVDTGTTIPGLIAALNDLSAATVNAEMVDALATDTYAEPTGAPAATDALATKIGYLYMALRNQLTITASAKTFFDDSGTAEWSKTLTDNGTTYTEAEGV